MNSIYKVYGTKYDYNTLVERINEYMETHLKDSRIVHTKGVVFAALGLCMQYDGDSDKAKIAALCHDIAKYMPDEEANAYVRKLNLPDYYINNNNLVHGKVACEIMKEEWGITDEDILNAVSYHTTGRAGMSTLEKIIFLADAAEPGRYYPGVDIVRAELEKSLDKGCISYLKRTLDYLKEEDRLIDPHTLMALEYLQEREKENE